MLFRADGLGEYISGVILYDETIRQNAADGTSFTRILEEKGILPGIKVDTGAKALAGAEDEKVTEGLDGLRDRVADYVLLGAKFAKWRAVITVGDGMPSMYCINANAHALARYARICQEGGLVPIVEPEVLMDGTHSLDRCAHVTELTLQRVFAELYDQGVALEGMILKPNMVIAGTDCAQQADVNTVAARTIESLRRTVPAAVPGIMFLSGGQSEADASAHLNAMNAKKDGLPWALSYSYGHCLAGQLLEGLGR